MLTGSSHELQQLLAAFFIIHWVKEYDEVFGTLTRDKPSPAAEKSHLCVPSTHMNM